MTHPRWPVACWKCDSGPGGLTIRIWADPGAAGDLELRLLSLEKDMGRGVD